ncbi:hypothetical protein CKM354_000203300 [Cercospora kikuchii]|uniref:Uncharacterized protein n=1 Tax=Cercospora kikuchii TaxID=84275 RepID=A0A9P3C9E0_9PEZI|nr:uncharacterized protein CKM354_000203300 [Cercospora kikuchii]GIZ38621.1 hypothetical protein CKM354_000203300 [Cercospora kikuchii]
MVGGSQSPCTLADANSGKKHEVQRIDRTWAPKRRFVGGLRVLMYVPSNVPGAEARTGDASPSNTRQQQSNQNQEAADSTGDNTPRPHNDDGAPSSRDTAAESHKPRSSKSNQNLPAQTTKEFIDLTGPQAIITRITEDEWRKKIGLPEIKRTEVDLTRESDKHDPFKEP